MGYTHYWYREERLPKAAWRRFKKDAKAIVSVSIEQGIQLAGGLGEGEPEVTDERVWLNGKTGCGHVKQDLGIAWSAPDAGGVESGPDLETGTWFGGAMISSRMCGGSCAHETFHIPRVLENTWQKPKKGLWFAFCKTAYKPYDVVVTALLLVALRHFPGKLRVATEGTQNDWADAEALCLKVLGYGLCKVDPEGGGVTLVNGQEVIA